MDKNKKKLVETLICGRNSARRLQSLLRRKVDNDGSVTVDHLVMDVMGSFSSSLSVLNSFHIGEFYGVPVRPRVDMACSVDRVPEFYSGETGKNRSPGVRKRRGSYKRRTLDSRVKISGKIEDGYAWRKYGQKVILNSKFPRCYFKCTYKHVLGCNALKQVQKMGDESNRFHITYFGHHTCPPPSTFSHPNVVLDLKDYKSHHHGLPNNPSTITSVHIDPSLEQDDRLSSPNGAHSFSPLVWKEIMINDLETPEKFGILSDIPFADVFFP